MFLAIATFHSANAATFSVTNSNSSGSGSFFQAITNANNRPGPDHIIITNPGGLIISNSNPLPTITETVQIAGDFHLGGSPTTPGFSIIGNSNSRPLLHLGLGATGSIVRGLRLAYTSSSFSAMLVEAESCSVFNCHLGVSNSGFFAPASAPAVSSGNGSVLTVNRVGNFRLGQPGDSFRNVIAGTVIINSRSSFIENNNFGITADGTQSAYPPGTIPPNLTLLVLYRGPHSVGGSDLAKRNYFAAASTAITYYPETYTSTFSNNVFGFLRNGAPAPLTNTCINYYETETAPPYGPLTRIEANFLHSTGGSAIRFFSQQTSTSAVGEIVNNQIGISPLGIETTGGQGITLTSLAPVVCQDNTIRNRTGAGITIAPSTPYVSTVPNIPTIIAFDPNIDVSQNSISGTLGGPSLLLASSPSSLSNPPNDALDGDSGPNGLLNTPVLTSITRPNSTSALVEGTFNSLPNQSFVIKYYSDRSNVPNPGPRDFLFSHTVTTNGSGNATLSATLPALSAGQWVTAIATSNALPRGPHCSPVSAAIQVLGSGRFVISSNPLSGAEGQSINFQINRINSSAGAASVRITTTILSPTASPGTDYSITGTDLPDGTVNFAAGQTSRTLTLNVLQDDIDEPSTESIFLTLVDPTNGASADITPKIANLIDDDASPTLTITSASITEGNEGQSPVAVFTANLSRPCERIATMSYVGFIGTSPNPTDSADTGTPTLLQTSPTTLQIQVPIRGDNAIEPDETFAISAGLELSTPAVGVFETVLSSPGTGTIINDDTLPVDSFTFSSSSTEVQEDVGTVTATIQRGNGTASAAVEVLAIDTNSVRGTDYLGPAKTILNFPPGILTQTVTYTIVDDNIDEDSESFTLIINAASGAGIGSANSYFVAIKNNDPPPVLTIADLSTLEGNDVAQLVYSLQLSIASRRTARVTCTTRAGSATNDQDFKPITQEIIFAPGSTTAEFIVPILGDTTFEPDETFFIDISLNQNLSPSNFTAEITLQNDDADHPIISFRDAPTSVPENAGIVPLTISRIGKIDVPAVFKIDQSGASTASSITDFTLPDGDLTIPANQSEITVNLTIIDDATPESTKAIVLELIPFDAITATAPPAGLTLSIADDDVAVEPILRVLQPETRALSNGESRSFGHVLSGNSQELLFSISNAGNAPLTGCNATIDGQNVSSFEIISNLPATIQPLASPLPLIVRFNATTAGEKNTTLTITSALGAFTIPLTSTTAVLSANEDSDNDGLSDLAEYQLRELGFDYTFAQPALVASLFAGSESAGLFTQSQLGALHVPSPLIAKNPTTGLFTLTIGVEKSTDLTLFTPFPMTAPQTTINPQGKLEFQFSSPDNKAFYLLRSNP